MHVLGIDPGITTGMAWVNEDGLLLTTELVTIPTLVIDLIREFKNSDYVVVVEDFVGAGPRTKEAIFVLKLIGMVIATCYISGLPCHLQVPQQRIPLLSEAKRRAPKHIVHEVDAFAHCLAYIERESNVIFSSE